MMRATRHERAPVRGILEDHPPVDKPTRLPLRECWRSRLHIPEPGGSPSLYRRARHRPPGPTPSATACLRRIGPRHAPME